MKLKTQKIDADVETALKRASWVDEKLILPPALERKLYERTNKALEALGGKWSRKDKAHVFEKDSREALQKLLSAGEYVDEKKSFDVFYTPAWLADELVQYLPWSANERPEARFLEPSAGEGALVGAIRRRFPEGHITTIEIRDDMKLFAPMGIAAEQKRLHALYGRDFLTLSPHGVIEGRNVLRTFDAIIMNPPFSARQDIDHVMHAWQFLKKGGALVAVMSRGSASYGRDGVQPGGPRKAFDFFNFCNDNHARWHDLPDDAFKPSGTLVRTSVLVATK